LRYCKSDNRANSIGIVPLKLLALKSKRVGPVMSPNSVGSDPVNAFVYTSKSRNCCRLPNSVGAVLVVWFYQ
jgi:hypothetical protein